MTVLLKSVSCVVGRRTA